MADEFQEFVNDYIDAGKGPHWIGEDEMVQKRIQIQAEREAQKEREEAAVKKAVYIVQDFEAASENVEASYEVYTKLDRVQIEVNATGDISMEDLRDIMQVATDWGISMYMCVAGHEDDNAYISFTIEDLATQLKL